MAPLIYTERFLLVDAGGFWFQWPVPTGKRAIVTNLSGVNTDLAAGQIFLQLGELPVAALYLASKSAGSVQLRVAVYAGESIWAASSSAGFGGQISGYLFDDPTGAKGPPPGAEQLPAPEEPPWPWPDE